MIALLCFAFRDFFLLANDKERREGLLVARAHPFLPPRRHPFFSLSTLYYNNYYYAFDADVCAPKIPRKSINPCVVCPSVTLPSLFSLFFFRCHMAG
jgi:hypothetical protein